MTGDGDFFDVGEHIQFPTGGIFSKVLRQTPTYQITLMCLSADSSIDTHTAARSATVEVLQGRGTFILEGREIPMKPGRVIGMPANAPHSLKADENLAILISLYS